VSTKYATTHGRRPGWTSWTRSRGSTTAFACTRPLGSSPLLRKNAASWLHDLMYVETRQGQAQALGHGAQVGKVVRPQAAHEVCGG